MGKGKLNSLEQTTKTLTKTKKTMWELKILPNKDKIIEWIENGASERQIVAQLGISYQCWLDTKERHPKEMEEIIDRPRAILVGKLKGALISRALGYSYEEEITEIKQDVDSNGKPVGKKYVYKRTLKQFAPPDTTAIFACLKIYDKDNIKYDDKAQMIDIKKQELEIKKKEAGTDEQESLVDKIKNFKIEFVDASRKDGVNYEDKGN